MKRFIPREKLGKKARKRLDGERRATWAFSPATKKVESKKLYNRNRRSHDRCDDYGMGLFMPFSGQTGKNTVLRRPAARLAEDDRQAAVLPSKAKNLLFE